MALTDYKIIKELGSGGFGKTYLVEAIKLPGQPNKVLKHFCPSVTPTPEGLRTLQRLFKEEATMLGKLGHHPQIPTLQEYIEERSGFYFVQEYIEGKNLRGEEVKDAIKLSEQKVLELLEEILEILAFIHEQGAIHLDLKPENIMRRKLDNKVVLIDFGGAKQTSALEVRPDGNTVVTVTVGTPGYMPSEQSNGTPRPASDVYAVGKIAIQALTGRHPFYIPEDVDTGEALWRGLANAVSPDFAKVIDKMICYHFKDRYKDASAALKAIKELKKTIAVTPIVRNPVPLAPQNNRVNVQRTPVSQILVFNAWYLIFSHTFSILILFAHYVMANTRNLPAIIPFLWFGSAVLAIPALLEFPNYKQNRLAFSFSWAGIIVSYLITLITRCATKKLQKNSQPKVLENRTNAISGENYVFYGIFYHCGIL